MSARRPGNPGATAFYTSNQVANLLGVSLGTVVNWEKQGRIDAHRTPGGHRRISREDLLRFCTEQRYPVPPELAGYARSASVGPPRVLLVHRDIAWAELVRDYLRLDREVDVAIADGGLDAGFRMAAMRPHLILLDLELGEVPARTIARLADELDPRPVLVGCAPIRGAEGEHRLADSGLAAVVARSTVVSDLARRLLGLLPGRSG